MDYSDLSQEIYDKILMDLMREMSADQIIQIPGIYELIREELNNDVLSKWEEENLED